ncbi:MAG: FAD:protein FMN transferase [Terracidiphilus sp.]|nr:FAD:protein FMN transferase [Terracidiphilus sp.]MDR3777421.1 FAD:protein FMN transferase [Terracidiphilus sp.]
MAAEQVDQNDGRSTAGAKTHQRTHRAMGTGFTLYVDCTDEAQAQSCFQTVFEEIDRVEATFSRFRPASEISRINREAADGPMVTDPEVFRLLATAMEISRKTCGVFDITVGRLTQAWGFQAGQPAIPDTATLAEAEAAVGWELVALDPAWRTVEFLRPGVELDAGGIAKGYAVDCALEALRAAGVHGLLDAGSSSIAASDELFGNQWTVGIANPEDSTKELCRVRIGRRALSTSGIREQSFSHEGRVYSHLIDPTARGHEKRKSELEVLQATVLAPSSMLADALSTAMFLLGPERGRIALRDFPECAVLWVCRGSEGVIWLAEQWPKDGMA